MSKDHIGNAWIGVDLDGTLAEYHGWKGMDHIGAPIPAMVDRIKRWLAEGKDVRIFTARICPQQSEADTDTALRAITHWCFANIGQQLPITCVKDWSMVELWDDRCIQVEANTGEPARRVKVKCSEYLDLIEERERLRTALRRARLYVDGTLGPERPIAVAEIDRAMEGGK